MIRDGQRKKSLKEPQAFTFESTTTRTSKTGSEIDANDLVVATPENLLSPTKEEGTHEPNKSDPTEPGFSEKASKTEEALACAGSQLKVEDVSPISEAGKKEPDTTVTPNTKRKERLKAIEDDLNVLAKPLCTPEPPELK